MAKDSCLVLQGNSVFLAGIKAELERCQAFELVTLGAGPPDLADLVRLRRPRAVLFDLAMEQPDFAVPLLRQQPDLLLIGIDPETHQAMVWSGRQAAAIQALTCSASSEGNVLQRNEREQNENKMESFGGLRPDGGAAGREIQHRTGRGRLSGGLPVVAGCRF